MAFGKKSLAAQPPALLAQIEENRVDLVVHKTEVKILQAPGPGTPLGDMHLLNATEEVMSNPAPIRCPECKELKNEVALNLSGMCAACWQKQELFA